LQWNNLKTINVGLKFILRLFSMQMNLILVLPRPKNATITFATISIATVSNAAVYRYIKMTSS